MLTLRSPSRILLSATLVLTGLLPSISVAAAEETHTVMHNVFFSHLSPLFRYEPADAWNITAASARATWAGANVSFDWMGSDIYVQGLQLGGRLEVSPALIIGDSWDGVYEVDAARALGNMTASPQAVPRGIMWYSFGLGFGRLELEPRQWSLKLDSAGSEADTPYQINMTGVQMQVQLPRNGPMPRDIPFANNTVVPAIEADNSTNPFFTGTTGWTSLYDNVSFARVNVVNGGVHSFASVDDVWPTTTTLATTDTDAPLRFAVPANSSLISYYGTVGPQQGRFELRLSHTGGPEPQDVGLGSLSAMTQSGSANRPVSAVAELLAYAYLDPRSQYEGEIVLVEEGRELGVHGLAFSTYIEDPSKMTSNWVEEYNERNIWAHEDKGLSGGQIAGIVVGSVAGAAIIGGLIFWLVRRRRRAQQTPASAPSKSGDGNDLHSVPTLVEENRKSPV